MRPGRPSSCSPLPHGWGGDRPGLPSGTGRSFQAGVPRGVGSGRPVGDGVADASDNATTPAGMVTACTMPLVAPEQIAPTTATTCSTFTTLLPASTAAFGSHCESAITKAIVSPSRSPPLAFTSSAANCRAATIATTSSAIGPVTPATEPTLISSAIAAVPATASIVLARANCLNLFIFPPLPIWLPTNPNIRLRTISVKLMHLHHVQTISDKILTQHLIQPC